MKKIIAVIFCTFTIFNTIAQISFMPSFDFFSLTTFKDEKPYIKPSFESSVNFNLQAFSEAYFDINFNFFMTEPLNVFNPDKKKRIPIKTFF